MRRTKTRLELQGSDKQNCISTVVRRKMRFRDSLQSSRIKNKEMTILPQVEFLSPSVSHLLQPWEILSWQTQ